MQMSGFWVAGPWDLDSGLSSSGLLSVWMFLLKFGYAFGISGLGDSRRTKGRGGGGPVDGSGPGKQPSRPSLLTTEVRTLLSTA